MDDTLVYRVLDRDDCPFRRGDKCMAPRQRQRAGGHLCRNDGHSLPRRCPLRDGPVMVVKGARKR